MERIKIAQIGVNRHSHAIPVFQSLKKQTEQFEIVGYALMENEEEKFADLLGVFDGYPRLTLEEILQSPDIGAVTVETEEIHLTKYALMAAEHKKNIHMEKPGGVDLAAFEKLIETVKKNDLVFHLGYMYRYNPYVIELMEKVKRGELGTIFSVEAQMNCRHTKEVRQWLENFPGGMMFFLGCHLIDLILQIRGKPENIIPLNRCTGIDGVTAQDYGMAVLEYPNGVAFAKTCAGEIGGFARRQLVVSGTKGTVELKPFEVVIGGGQYTDRTEYTDDRDWCTAGERSRTELYDRYDAMMAAFAKMARGEMKNPYSCDYELELYQTILKCCGNQEELR